MKESKLALDKKKMGRLLDGKKYDETPNLKK